MLLEAFEKLNPFVRRGLEILSRHREQKPRCHILNLPDEVLASIFKFASVADKTLFEAGPFDFDSNLLASSALPLTLSSTCRHFRRIALESSALWTVWHNIDVSGSKLFRKRRGGKPLTVYIDTVFPNRMFRNKPNFTFDDILEFANFTLKSAQSLTEYPADIQTLVIERSQSQQGEFEMSEPNVAIKSAWGVATYPLLEELTVIYSAYLYEDGAQFFDAWVMPRLRRVSLLNAVPKDKSLIAMGKSLTSVQLVFTKRINAQLEDIDISLPNLLDFISGQQSLAELAIRFDEGVLFRSTLPIQSVILPSLKTFQLYLGRRHCMTMSEYILQPLKMPLLRSFFLAVECDIGDLSRLVSNVLHGVSTSTEIQHFDLRFMDWKSPCGTADLSVVLDLLRSLRSLSINGPEVAGSLYSINMDQRLLTIARDLDGLEPSSFPLPLLERIRFRGDAFSPTFLKRLLEAFAAKGPKHLDQIREVVLQNCSCFDGTLEEIYHIIPRDRVIWLDEISTL